MSGGRWRRLVMVLSVVGALGAGYVGWSWWRFETELSRARSEIEQKAMEPARQRLERLATWRLRPGWRRGEADYWLGVSRWMTQRREAALAAFERVPPDSEFRPKALFFQAEADVRRGRLRSAEQRLEAIIQSGGSEAEPARDWLERVYRIGARFEEVRALLQEQLERDEARDPSRTLKTLHALWLLDRGTIAPEAARANLEQARALAPDDDRVWLGEARLAILERRWDEAEQHLRRCLDHQADAAVWRGWLDWAHGANRPDEVLRALRHLSSELTPAEIARWRAWFFQRAGRPAEERRELERLLEHDPGDTVALERLAALCLQQGDPDRAVTLRRAKADVDQALDQYHRRMVGDDRPTRLPDQLTMAALAETAGRWPDARAWYALARRSEPDNAQTREALARLDHLRHQHQQTSANPPGFDPWNEFEAMVRASQPHALGSPTAVAFTEEAEAAGLHFTYHNGESVIRQMPEPLGGGVALLDYDGDGWMDVYVVQGGPFPPDPNRPHGGDRLFRNRGDGTFEDVTEAAGIARFARGYGHGVTVGDYDNDGHPDLFVTRWRSYALYRNKGDGTFEDVTAHVGLDGQRDWPTSAAFADFDGDGDLDLYVCHYLVWDPSNPLLCHDPTTNTYIYCNPRNFDALPDHVFRNDDGWFTDVTIASNAITPDGRGLGVVAADLDGDGLIDLYVANDTTANFLYRNQGDFIFEELGHEAGVAANAEGGYQAGMGVALGDFDGDGRPDLAVTNFFGEGTTFYQNLGMGVFSDQTAAIGLLSASRYLLGFGIAFLDANNDGQLDLVTANGHLNDFPDEPYKMPIQLLLGQPDGTMRDVTSTAGAPFQVPRLGRGLAIGDLDNDGRLDVLVIDHNAPLAYLRNRTEGGHFLTLKLEGTTSNRDAIGAVVTVEAGGRRQTGFRYGGGSYQSANDPRLHFGLGESERVEAVAVRWPSGQVDRYEDLPADTGYHLIEGDPEPKPLAGFKPH